VVARKGKHSTSYLQYFPSTARKSTAYVLLVAECKTFAKRLWKKESTNDMGCYMHGLYINRQHVNCGVRHVFAWCRRRTLLWTLL